MALSGFWKVPFAEENTEKRQVDCSLNVFVFVHIVLNLLSLFHLLHISEIATHRIVACPGASILIFDFCCCPFALVKVHVLSILVALRILIGLFDFGCFSEVVIAVAIILRVVCVPLLCADSAVARPTEIVVAMKYSLSFFALSTHAFIAQYIVGALNLSEFSFCSAFIFIRVKYLSHFVVCNFDFLVSCAFGYMQDLPVVMIRVETLLAAAEESTVIDPERSDSGDLQFSL